MAKRKILVLDDEELILEIVTEFLKLLNLEVETAETGKGAISKFKNAFESKEPFSLVLFDMTLSDDMDGAKVLREIKKIDPNIKAIVSTGGDSSDIMADHQRLGFDAALPKPYSIDKLKEVLERISDEMSKNS